MTPRTLVSSAAVGLLTGVVLALNGVTLGPAPKPEPIWPAEPVVVYPTCVGTDFGTREPAMPCYHPDRREPPARTATAVVMETWTATMGPMLTRSTVYSTADAQLVYAGITPTPCPVPPTAVAPWLMTARCYRPYEEATREARIASGESYEMRQENGPDGTPVVTFRGTVPPYAATAYAADGVEIRRR